MKKALLIQDNFDIEVVSYSKIGDYLNDYSKGQLCENLRAYYTNDAENYVVINDESYGLPLLVIPNVKMNNYDLESLASLFANIENEAIDIDDDDFWSEDDDYEDEEQETKDEDDNW